MFHELKSDNNVGEATGVFFFIILKQKDIFEVYKALRRSVETLQQNGKTERIGPNESDSERNIILSRSRQKQRLHRLEFCIKNE